MSLKQDPDLTALSLAELRHIIMRLRRGIRKHRDAEGNARCWHNDLELYALLPEGKLAGRMVGDENVLLGNCKRYIRRQQCTLVGCAGKNRRSHYAKKS